MDPKNVSVDLPKSLYLSLTSNAKIYKSKSIAPSESLLLFFKNSLKESLRKCLLVVPITIESNIPILKERMTINQGSYIHTDPGGELNFSPGDLLAPRVKIISKNGGVIELDSEVWVGAGATILADGKKIKIGRGSIIAAGAEITEDIKECSVVVTKEKVIKFISEKDIISNLPAKWIDPDEYYYIFEKNSYIASRMMNGSHTS